MRSRNVIRLAVFVVVAACSKEPTSPIASRVVAPACTNPAPLVGQFNPRAPLLLVIFRDGVAADAEISDLTAKFAFTPVLRWPFGFAALLTPEALAGVRCEASVRLVEHDGLLTIDKQ